MNDELFTKLRDACADLAINLSKPDCNIISITCDQHGAITGFDQHGIWHVFTPSTVIADPDPTMPFTMPDGTTLNWHQQRNGTYLTDRWLGLRLDAEGTCIGNIGPVQFTDIQRATEDAWNEV